MNLLQLLNIVHIYNNDIIDLYHYLPSRFLSRIDYSPTFNTAEQ